MNKIETALGLMYSMICGGESHSPTSVNVYDEAKRELAELRAALDIALKDQPELGDYSKTAVNFHNAWSVLYDEYNAYRQTALVEADLLRTEISDQQAMIDQLMAEIAALSDRNDQLETQMMYWKVKFHGKGLNIEE